MDSGDLSYGAIPQLAFGEMWHIQIIAGMHHATLSVPWTSMISLRTDVER